MIGKKLMNGFLKVFGDIKIFRWPFFLIYDPSGYMVKGEDVREAINVVRPGDILVRGYRKYLDGYFIPGYFSHAGLYLGKVTDADKRYLASKDAEAHFKTGEQMVVHSMAEGVFMEDLINFCRCDYMAILRFPDTLEAAQDVVAESLKPGDFTAGERKIFDSLKSGNPVVFAEAYKSLFKVALSQVGKPYDFQFNFSNFNNLSCTELVCFVFKSLELYHELGPKKKRFFIFEKEVLTPDALVSPKLQLSWQSQSVDKKKMAGLRKEVAKTG